MPFICAKDWEYERDAAADCLGTVRDCGRGQEELLGSRGVFPGDYGGAVEEDLERFAGGEDGGDAGVAVGYVYLCLWGEAGGDGIDGEGFLWAVDHGVGEVHGEIGCLEVVDC